MNRKEWQERLLPWMTGSLVVLSVFFFLSSLGQLVYLQAAFRDVPGLDSEAIYATIEELAAETDDAKQMAIQRALLSRLELHTIARKYHVAQVGMMANVWVKYLGFVTGMILAVVGSVFILGKLRVPMSEVGAEVASIRYHVRSASPGLILAVLGVALMLTTVVIRHSARVSDAAVYISERSVVGVEVEDGSGDSTGGDNGGLGPNPEDPKP